MNLLLRSALHALAILVLVLCAALPARAQVPQILNYQGRITVGTTAFTGTGQFRFALVDGTGAATFWSNDGTSNAGSEPAAAVALPVVNGLYVVPLGDPNVGAMPGIPASVFANSDVRLRVWFNDGTNGSQPLTPDQRITSVGYAMVAGTVSDGAITAAKIAPGQTLAVNIAGNAATATTASDPTRVLKAGDTMSGALSMGGNTITNLGSPTGTGDAATRGYVDPQIAQLQGSVSNLQANKLNVTGYGGGLTDLNAGTLSSGVVPSARLGGSYSNSVTFSNASNSFTGDGSGLTNLSGAALQAATVPVTGLASAARPKFDRQRVTPANFPPVVLSGTPVDVPGMVLTTKSLGGSGTYLVHFQIAEFPQASGMFPSYVLSVNGVEEPLSRSYSLSNGNLQQYRPATLHYLLTGIASGTVIKVRAVSFASSGTMNWYGGQLIIDGVLDSQVVP